MSSSKTAKKLTSSVLTVIILSLCLCITTIALLYTTVTVENNLFRTALVKINLNDGKPIINEDEFIFEPGMTVKKDFFIENQSTWDVYYRVYFDNLEGELAEILDVTVNDGNTVIYKGKVAEMTKENVVSADSFLKIGEKRILSMSFHFPSEYGNETENLSLSFDVLADAVQTKNNPDRLFE